MAETFGARMQHDVGPDFKVPLPMFSGRNDDWPVWSARFVACAELAGWTAVLEVAEAQTAMVGASPDPCCIVDEDRGQSFQHCSSRGLEASTHRIRRILWSTFWEKKVRHVVCPREHWLADVNARKDFLTSLSEWEIKVAAYEVASGDKIGEAVWVVTIMDHAPDAVKSMLRQSPLEQRRSVDALKNCGNVSQLTQRLGSSKGRSRLQIGAVKR